MHKDCNKVEIVCILRSLTVLGTTIYIIFDNNIVWIITDSLAFESRFQI